MTRKSITGLPDRSNGNLTARFICSYQGEADYDVGDVRYSVRARACTFSTATAEMRESERQQVGCVYRRWGRDGFPPEDVVALFPGYIAARYDQNARRYVYRDGEEPRVKEDLWGLVAVAYLDEVTPS